MSKKTIFQAERTKYEDQYGFQHDAYRKAAEVEVVATDEFVEWMYYTERIRDRIWIDGDGRKYRTFSKTDYGPSSSMLIRLDDNQTFYSRLLTSLPILPAEGGAG